MKIVGCDLHAKQQTIPMVDTEAGEFTEKTLAHEENRVREFYAALEGPVGVGIEAIGAKQWFLQFTPFFRAGLNHSQGTFLLWTKRGHFYCGMTLPRGDVTLIV